MESGFDGKRSYEQLMTAGEVALLFGVNTRTVCSWADEGKLKGFKTPGGKEWRFFRSYVYRKFNGDDDE